MASTPVKRDQFNITPQGIEHKPTGASYAPHPGCPFSGNMRMGNLGNRLPNGDDYRPDQVRQMMEQLWAEYVHANPEHFKTAE